VDLETERAVIGCLVLSAGVWPDVTAKILGGLTEADFQREAHRVLFTSIQRAKKKRVGLKGRYLLGWLKRDGALDAVGFPELSEVVTAFWLRGHMDYYLRRLREIARQRAAVEGTWSLIPVAYEMDTQKWLERVKEITAEVER
jgi:replicative DNA helicase